MENQIRQTENKAFVIGILKENNIQFKPAKSSGRLMASGYLTLVVNTESGKGEVKVRVQQFADKKDGTPNSLYKGLQTVSQTYKSIKDVGEAEADLIKVEGQLEDGTYYSQNKGDFIEKLEIKGTFISRLTDKNTPHCCKVGFEGYISKTTPKDQELEVEIIGIGYEGVAIPVTGLIPPHLVVPFQQKYTVGCTTTLNFSIVNEVEVQQVQSEVGFGEGLGEVIERHTTKRVIFGGGAIQYAGTGTALTEDVIRKGLAIRQANLEKKKEDAINYSNNGGMSQGFGSAINTNSQPGFGGAINSNPSFGGVFPMGGAFPQ